MPSAKVSILIPIYNAARYLTQCLDSVVGQTYRNLQICLINDGSTDNSDDICRQYASADSRIEYLCKPNEGVAATRNRLLNMVSGDYVLFVDADDWIERNMIESMLAISSENGLDIVVCGNVAEYDNTTTEIDISVKETEILTQSQVIERFLQHRDFNGSLWNKIIKSTLLSGISFDNTIWYGEDALFIWQVLQRVEHVGIVETPYYHYRMNDASISHQQFGQRKMTGHKVWQQIYYDTARLWPQYESLAKASFAISDMWLMFYAALDQYSFDDNICCYQRHIRKNILDIFHAKHLKFNKKMFALGMAVNYRLVRLFIRKLI